jgi:hypothetical protein
MEKIKLYHLKPYGYGAEYFVASESPERAIDAIEKWLKSDTEKGNYNEYTLDMIRIYKETGKFLEDTFYKAPRYSLEEYPINTVIRSEIA